MEQVLKELFLNVLNMSITAGYVILFVLLVRALLKKAPKIFSYSLWAVVLFRLVCPFSFSSSLSFLGFFRGDSIKQIPEDIGFKTQPQVNAPIYNINQTINNSQPAANPIISAEPIQTIQFIISLIWVTGILSLLIYSVVTYLQLKRKVSMAILLDGNVYECENIRTPFVLGIIRPKIYLPMGLSESEKGYIIKHEETHIKRFDYIIKPFAFLVLCIHWFNPLVWISYKFMNKDMEMSCDENVLKKLGPDIKKAYCSSLLSLAAERKIISGSPLAFGERNTKSRIKNVLNYRKPAFWVIILGAFVIAVISLGLMANPKKYGTDLAVLDIDNIAIKEKTYKAAAESTGVKINEKKPELASEIAALVENSIDSIMSSPQQSSSPEDYIKANQNAYEDIIKQGEDGLLYMLSQFEQGNAEGLRGQIMMRLCKEILGQRNNVSDESLSPKEWFSQLDIKQRVDLPDFVYRGNDPIEKLVYETEVQKHKDSRGGFTILASHIFGSYKEGNKLKVFVTTHSSHYVLYDKTLSNEGGSIIPAAITYIKNPDGSYRLEKYEQAKDGSYFGSSIKEYCVMPLSGKKINGLSEKILNHYRDYKDILEQERENLIEHLKVNNQYGVFLYQKLYKKPEELVPLT